MITREMYLEKKKELQDFLRGEILNASQKNGGKVRLGLVLDMTASQVNMVLSRDSFLSLEKLVKKIWESEKNN